MASSHLPQLRNYRVYRAAIVQSIVSAPKREASTVYVSSPQVWRSPDCTKTWQETITLWRIRSLECEPFSQESTEGKLCQTGSVSWSYAGVWHSVSYQSSRKIWKLDRKGYARIYINPCHPLRPPFYVVPIIWSVALLSRSLFKSRTHSS